MENTVCTHILDLPGVVVHCRIVTSKTRRDVGVVLRAQALPLNSAQILNRDAFLSLLPQAYVCVSPCCDIGEENGQNESDSGRLKKRVLIKGGTGNAPSLRAIED